MSGHRISEDPMAKDPGSEDRMFASVLIANRGEIALRVISTLKRLGIESIAVFSDADAEAPHVLAADRALHIGPAPAADSYLSVERIVQAALHSGADAIHPGYGFLSERPDFARACEQAGIVFVGPSAEAIALLGDKAAAKRAAVAAGVPVVPGLTPEEADGALSDEQIAEWAAGQELPLLLKAAGGGGGKGMRVVERLHQLPEAIAAARREAAAAFGDERLIVERYLQHARHIEIQVLADAHRNAIHLGERECSLQRRHQKVIEEAPSPVVGPELRQEMGAAALRLASSCSYVGAGTVEMIAERDRPESFFFLEMNARLQVEHPVTEAVTGLDLVELQLRVAAGERLPISQEDVRLQGHAIEARIYAEDPSRGFLPSTGRVFLYREPEVCESEAREPQVHESDAREPAAGEPEPRESGGIRIDSGVTTGTEVGTHYDPMLAKAIAHAPDRAAAIQRLRRGLAQTRLLGLTTNVPWLIALLGREEVLDGALDTGLIERLGEQVAPEQLDEQLAADLALVARLGGAGATTAGHRGCADEPNAPGEHAAADDDPWVARDDPWAARDGWSLVGPQAATMRLQGPSGTIEARALPDRDRAWLVEAPDGRERSARQLRVTPLRDGSLRVEAPHGAASTVEVHRDREAVWLVADGVPIEIAPAEETATRHAGADTLQAPMPGIVLDVRAATGDSVAEGDVLVVLESMKMELTVASPEDGVLGPVHVAVGDRVAQGQTLLEMEAQP